MSLVGTLAKVALGVAIAKGVSALAKGNANSAGGAGGGLFGGASDQTAQGGLGDLLGGMLGGGSAQSGAGAGGLGGLLDQLSGGQATQDPSQGQASGGQASGGLGDLLGGMLGGGSAGQTAGAQGGLGDLLGGLMGGGAAGQTGGSAQGGLGDLLGGLLGAAGGGAAAGGGLGGLLGALTGGADASASNDQSLGQVLNSSFSNQGEPDVEPTPHQNAAAAIMLSAMIQAAKADGAIQDAEKQKLLGNLKDANPEEMDFVKAQLAAPVSIPTLVAHVPAGLQAQVYTMSVMAIDLDNQAEAQYLNDLAKAMGMGPKQVNGIHAQLGVPALYA